MGLGGIGVLADGVASVVPVGQPRLNGLGPHWLSSPGQSLPAQTTHAAVVEMVGLRDVPAVVRVPVDLVMAQIMAADTAGRRFEIRCPAHIVGHQDIDRRQGRMLFQDPAGIVEAGLGQDRPPQDREELPPGGRLLPAAQTRRHDPETLLVEAVLSGLAALGHHDVIRLVVATGDQDRAEVHDLGPPVPTLAQQGVPVSRTAGAHEQIGTVPQGHLLEGDLVSGRQRQDVFQALSRALGDTLVLLHQQGVQLGRRFDERRRPAGHSFGRHAQMFAEETAIKVHRRPDRFLQPDAVLKAPLPAAAPQLDDVESRGLRLNHQAGSPPFLSWTRHPDL